MSLRNNSFADYNSHHRKKRDNQLLSEHYRNLDSESALQKKVESDNRQIQICNTKMTEMESLISDFQHNQQSLHYLIKKLNQKIDTLDSKLDQRKNQENVQLCSDISCALQTQQDFSLQLNHETVQKTNQLFNRLYAQIHDYIGVTDEKQIQEIKIRIKELVSSNYDYFHA